VHLPLRARLVIPADVSSGRTARAAVHDLCARASVETDTADVAQLLVSELVSNAHEHAGGDALLDVAVDDCCLRVDVVDESPQVPAPRPAGGDDERGRGLMLVEALSSRWGATPWPSGKTMWFELDRT
jgi:anti-sigma regulatory factor (Ser/Thr protein kinase)